MEILVPEVESYLEGCVCVKFHAQTQCSLVLEISENLSRKLENVVSTIL